MTEARSMAESEQPVTQQVAHARPAVERWLVLSGLVPLPAFLALHLARELSLAFATDVSAGATFALGKRATEKRGIRFLITPEIGYSFTTATSLRANPGREDDELLGADADTNLRSVALSGFFWRTTVGVAF